MTRSYSTTFAQRQAAEARKLARHFERCRASLTPEQAASLADKAKAAKAKLLAKKGAR
jgi:hypothetical protein